MFRLDEQQKSTQSRRCATNSHAGAPHRWIVCPQPFHRTTGCGWTYRPPDAPPYPSKSSPCQNAAGDPEVDGEGIEEARRGDLLVRAEIQHLGIRRCVSDPPSNRGRLTVWESHDLAQI